MSNRFLIVIVFAGVTSIPAKAQLRLPQIDIEAKAAGSFVESKLDNVNDTFNFSFHGAAHIQINQHVAIGAFYTRSMQGNVTYGDKGSGGTAPTNPTQLLSTGADLRFSAGRSVKWRPYLSLTYSKVEFVETQGNVNLASTTNALGANIGVMLRLGNNLYWNVIEIGGKQLNDKIYWLDANKIFEAKMGLTYNIRIKNK